MSKWKIVKFNDVLSIKNGKNQKAVENSNGKYPIYGSGGIMSYADDYLCPEFTTIIGRKGSINNPIYVEEKFWNVDTAFGLVADIEKLFPKYLFYFCANYNFERHNKAVTIPSLTKSDLLGIKMPLPPLEEQHKIAKNLDLASDLVKLYKTKLEELDKLIQSVFYDMFGDPVANEKSWEVRKLGKIAKIGSSKRVFVEELVQDGVPFYRGTEVGALATGEKIKPMYYITKEHYYRLCEHSGKPVIGDLLMPSICYDGRIWRVDNENEFYFKDGRVLWVHFLERQNNDVYLQYFLREKIVSDYHNIASGTTFAELKIFALKDILVMLPPLQFQQKFADIVTKIDEQKTEVNKAQKDAKTLYNSLMQEYFE